MEPSRTLALGGLATAGALVLPRRRGGNVALLALLIVGLLGLAAEQAQATQAWGPVTPAAFADGVQNATPYAALNSVSCASAGNCTAVGSFKNVAGSNEAFAQTLTNGVWRVAEPADLSGIAQGWQGATLNAVSCGSVGNCTAVGSFQLAGGDGETEAFAQTQTNGEWGPAVAVVFPNAHPQNAAPVADLNSVSCASAGNCTAVGSFRNLAGNFEAFAVTQAAGAWGPAEPTTFSVAHPQHSEPGDDLVSVSCVSPGNCTAVGQFKVGYGEYKAFAQAQIDGVWGDAVPFDFSAAVPSIDFSQGGAEAVSVSCTGGDGGNCAAVGTYRTRTSRPNPFMVTQTGGTWGQAATPAGINSTYFRSVSCSGVGDCTALGDGFAVTQTGGTWGTAARITLPADIESDAPRLEMRAVSCASAGNCAAVGSYELDAGYSPFTWMQTGGTWSTGSPSDFGSLTRAPMYLDDYLYSVSCAGAGAGECTAVGVYVNADDNNVAFSQTQSSGGTPPPANAGGADAPTITGEAVVGETLTAGHGTWSNPPASEDAYGYLWQVSDSGTGGWAAITDADPNRSSLVVPAAYEGRYLRVQVIAYGDVTSEPAYSAVSARVTRRGASTPSETPRATPLQASSAAALQLFSPAPGITVGATRGAVTLAASVRAACRDLVRGAHIWVRPTSKVSCLKRSLPAALSLRNGLVQTATPGAYPIKVRIKRANGTTVTRAITVTVR